MFVQTSATYAQVTVEITARIAPPPLPFYTQPPCPVDGYLWTPGYWSYADDDYYWVPGVWVRPPRFGFFWTPCYWGYSSGYYGFHSGYWGPHVGYYGGVNYGYGYCGSGFYGGRWEGEHFHYNAAVVNVNRTVVHRTYVERAPSNNNSRVSYNGPGGSQARPSRHEEAFMHERHEPPTMEQSSHQQGARRDRSQFARENRGRPGTASMNKVGGQGYDPRGQHSQGQSVSGHRQPNENGRRGADVHSSPQHNNSSPANNRRDEHSNNAAQNHGVQSSQRQSVHSQENKDSRHQVAPVSHNNTQRAQPSPQHNANPSNNRRESQPQHVNNNRPAQQQNVSQPSNRREQSQPVNHSNNRSAQPAVQHNAGQSSNRGGQQKAQPNNNRGGGQENHERR
jgi:hypothetical protein